MTIINNDMLHNHAITIGYKIHTIKYQYTTDIHFKNKLQQSNMPNRENTSQKQWNKARKNQHLRSKVWQSENMTNLLKVSIGNVCVIRALKTSLECDKLYLHTVTCFEDKTLSMSWLVSTVLLRLLYNPRIIYNLKVFEIFSQGLLLKASSSQYSSCKVYPDVCKATECL